MLYDFLNLEDLTVRNLRAGSLQGSCGALLRGAGVDRDFFKLHALGLEYDAIIFYDTDVCLHRILGQGHA